MNTAINTITAANLSKTLDAISQGSPVLVRPGSDLHAALLECEVNREKIPEVLDAMRFAMKDLDGLMKWLVTADDKTVGFDTTRTMLCITMLANGLLEVARAFHICAAGAIGVDTDERPTPEEDNDRP